MKDYLKTQGYSEKQIEEIMENQKEVLENSQIETETTTNSINSSTTETETVEKEDTKVETKVDTKLDNGGVDNRFKKSQGERMTKNMIYLLFRDGEEEKVKEEVSTKTETKEETKVEEKEEQLKEEKTKKETNKTEKKVSITAKEFEEYKQFKLNSMSSEEREKALKE